MFKLFKNLLLSETKKNKSDLAISVSGSSFPKSWEAQIAQANFLWEQGKLSEALAIYGLAIENNPDSIEIQQLLGERLRQQGGLAEAYEKLATDLKNHGNVEQAANYYRQAIHIKTLTGNTKEKLFRSATAGLKKTPIPLTNLKDAAFSFQPLANANSSLTKVPSAQAPHSNLESNLESNIEVEPSNVSPTFSQRLKIVNPQQARDIDWETAQVYLQKALEHSEKQEWKESALACKLATQIMPDIAEAYKVWGNALQRMGKTGEAMSCYAKAVEVEPNLAEVYAGIADIYVQQEKWQQAIKHYQKATIIRPSSSIYRSLADVWQKLGESDKAQLNLYRAKGLETSSTKDADPELDEAETVQLDSEPSVEAYCRLAQKLEEQNKWKQAALYYRKALDLSTSQPTLPAAVEQKPPQQVSEQQESKQLTNNSSQAQPVNTPESQLDKAIKRYHKQSRLQPNSPKVHTDLGNLYARKGKWQYAIACYRKAIKLSPRYAKAHLNLSRIQLKIGKQQEFIKEMQVALAIEPKIGSAIDRFYLGNALADRGQLQQAISCYYKAIVLNPRFIQSYHRLSEVLSKQNKHQEAIEFLKRGIESNPEDPETYYFLGQQLELLGKWESAVKIYSKVLQMEPQYPGASQKLNHALANKLKRNYKVTENSAKTSLQ